MATSQDDTRETLKIIEGTIDKRLSQEDTKETPVVLVIDELAFLNKTSVGKEIAHTMERISTEGRKCGVYMLASSQTWLVSRTGNDSVVRDTLTSAYVHRIKPKQASVLLQDKEEAEKVKKGCKKAGDVLFVPVGKESEVCKMPFATAQDMEIVCQIVKQSNGKNIAIPLPRHAHGDEINFKRNDKQELLNVEPEKPIEFVDPIDENSEFLQKIRDYKDTQQLSLGELSRRSEVDKGLLSKVLRGLEPLSNGVKKSLETLLTTGTQQHSTLKEARRNVFVPPDVLEGRRDAQRENKFEKPL